MNSLNHFLYWIGYVIYVVAGVSALFEIFPAYRRGHNRAFLYLGFAFLVFIFLTVSDTTLELSHLPRDQYLNYMTLRRATGIVGFILLAVGVISLARSNSPRRNNAGEDHGQV